MGLAMLKDGTFQVRLAKQADAEHLAHIASLLGQSLTAERFAQDIAHYAKGFFVSEIDGKVVAYMVLRKEHAPKSLHVHAPLQLWRMYVAPALQGKGVAAGLMEQALDSARERGIDAIWLGTSEDNVRAIAFYSKHNLAPIGTAHLHAGDNAHEDLIMLWQAE
jgi:ribosomal protein S18 acetylase RimI-like enzyme